MTDSYFCLTVLHFIGPIKASLVGVADSEHDGIQGKRWTFVCLGLFVIYLNSNCNFY